MECQGGVGGAESPEWRPSLCILYPGMSTGSGTFSV